MESLYSVNATVARANKLPISLFANLIWQESRFESAIISRAGAQGIAQFMPETASEYGLLNPFEPIHALHSAGRMLRSLSDRLGNLGLAAAAYNALNGGQSAADCRLRHVTLCSQ
jgi:soluble lytic murein transglycosylase-like protein